MSTQVGIYRSNITPIDRLLTTTVGRKDMLTDLVEKLAGGAGKKGGQHYLFIGPRGIGKTHFLTLIQNAVANDKKLGESYTFIRFPEENNRILSFADFLLGVVEILAETLDDEMWRTLHRSLALNENDNEVVDTIEPRLKAYRKEAGKTLLMLIENLDALFTQQMKREQDIHRFRSFLMDSPCATLIGTSPVYFPALYSTKSPLYDFFDIQVLEDLAEEETVEMIRKNLAWEKRDDILSIFDSIIPKIQAIHIMTGGNPRLIMMLYELIAHDNIYDAKLQFQKLLDQISPFYQDRLKELAPQERALIETVALMRSEPRTPAAIAGKLRKSQQQTSSLLKRMTQAGYLTVADNPADKRSRLYRIKEGFFDLWLAMSESRVQHKKLPYLVNFFEVYYSDLRDRETKRRALWEKIEEEKKDDTQCKNSSEILAYLSDVGDADEKYQAKLELAIHNIKEGKADEAKSYLQETAPIMPERPTFVWMKQQAYRWADGELGLDVRKWLDELIEYWRRQRYGDLEKAAEIALRLSMDLSGSGLHGIRIELLQGILAHEGNGKAKTALLLQIAESQKMDGRLGDALASLERALQLCRESGNKGDEGATLNNISQVYHAQGNYETALTYLKQSLTIVQQIGNKAGEGATLNNISQVYHAQGNYETALAYLTQSLTIVRQSGDKWGEGRTLNNISQVYHAQGNYETALTYLKQSLTIVRQIGDKGSEGTTLNNISQIYYAQGDYETALTYLKQSLTIMQQIGDKQGEGATINNISQIYYAQADYETALTYLKQSLTIVRQIGDKQGMCAILINIGNIHAQKEQKEEAFSAWVTVYRTAKQMGLAQALRALEKLAPELGMPAGLAGWEELAQRLPKGAGE
ncbi:MAG: tetratricopeptide repeat protein [Deltaproteobacteria bacterium]|nr:tetratricopeptide repeat protein [Deltaproteobacteria bacterium]